jgi:hypothetical protein
VGLPKLIIQGSEDMALALGRLSRRALAEPWRGGEVAKQVIVQAVLAQGGLVACLGARHLHQAPMCSQSDHLLSQVLKM